MDCFRWERLPIREMPDIRLLYGLEDHLQQIKELKNRIWHAISRALGAKNIRTMARRVNSWFSKGIHGSCRQQWQQDAETAVPVQERASAVSPESVADPLADLGQNCLPISTLTN